MPEADSVRFVLVDDHEVVRGGLRRVLEAQPGWSVEAEAGDIDRALRAVLGHKPDILVLDLNLARRLESRVHPRAARALARNPDRRPDNAN